ncbi:MAG: 50S ribosomal protein L6 [Bacteroidales bacterium]|jgi:large subunit ribosomal protein L6
MSKIGKLPVFIPKGVNVTLNAQNFITVKGPHGELYQQIAPSIKINIEESQISVTKTTESQQDRAFHGLYRSLIANMVKGVSEGYRIEQELVGVGYKVTVSGQMVEFILGYSHHIFMELPKEIKAESTAERGKSQTLILKSADKQLLGQVVSKIRSLRKPEPYKGKGIKFINEQLRRKSGKTAATAAEAK